MYPSREYKICRLIAHRCGFFEDIAYLFNFRLSEEIKGKVEIISNDTVYDLEEQIFLRYIDNRKFTFLKKKELLHSVNTCLRKYRCLLESNLNPSRVRNALVEALMDIISTGAYASLWDSWCKRFEAPKTVFSPKVRSGCSFRDNFMSSIDGLNGEYPLIPSENKYTKSSYHRNIIRVLSRQILTRLGYSLFLNAGKDEGELKDEFFRRHRGCLERLSRGSVIFINKYKGRMFRDMETKPSEEGSLLVEEITNTILGLLNPEEQSIFEETDNSGNAWNLEQQIKDRYRSLYPSFVPMEEIKEGVRKIVEDFRPLMSEENMEVIREVMLDEIERMAFVSRDTHHGNREMKQNLDTPPKGKPNDRVSKAIDFIVEFLPSDSTSPDLRKYLLARGNKATLRYDLRQFQEFVRTLEIYTPYSPKDRKCDTSSGADLQLLLELLDGFFRHPNIKCTGMRPKHYRLDASPINGNIPRILSSFCEVYKLT